MLINNTYVPIGATPRSMLLVLVMSLVALALSATTALAASCAFSGSTVTIAAAASESVTVLRGPGADATLGTTDDTIQTNATGTFVNCSTATVSNTNTIATSYGNNRADQGLVIDLSNGEFVPGANETGADREIEFTVNLGTGVGDTLTVVGSTGADHIVFGRSAVAACAGGTGRLSFNLNAQEATDDCDTTAAISNVENFVVAGSGGDDIISFGGAEGTGNAFLATATYSIGGGGGDDEITGSLQADTITGGAGDDDLTGGEGDDSLDGGDDYDAVAGGVGADMLDDTGTGSTNTLNYITSSASITVDLEASTSSGGDAGGDVIAAGSFQNVLGSDFNDTITGSATANFLLGGLGDDLLNGGGGNDIVNGQRGADTLNGGAGDDGLNPGRLVENDIVRGGDAAGDSGKDRVTYLRCEAAVTIDLTLTTAQDTGGCGSDTFAGVEQIRGSAYNDTLVGDATDNYIVGGAGADILNGGDGADLLQGFRGADEVNGQAGNDTLFGGDGDDTLLGGADADYANGESGSNDACTAETKVSCEA
ncbi:MAG: hypothetical protein QOG04_90 [Actinomycetota bacterium]|nr:hypothetical protein [Actinomycetota bacterium]